MSESSSVQMRALLHADPAIVVWWGTPVECQSALHRLHRLGDITSNALDEAVDRLGFLALTWHEIQPRTALRVLASKVLSRHPLKAADALQLAAALQATQGLPALPFVCQDTQMRRAAIAKGLNMFPGQQQN